MNIKKKDASFSEYGWTKNPFSLEIYPSLFTAHSREKKIIEDSIKNSQKYIILTGPTGIGKTTFLKWLATKNNALYIPKPPINEKEIVSIFRSSILKPTIIERIFGREKINIYNLADHVNKKQNGRQFIFMIDEAHETSQHVLEWLRTLVDHIEGGTLILSGLKKLKTEKLSHIETLKNRISVDLELEALTKDETIDLIKNRVEYVGGHNLNPFTLDAISRIYSLSGGIPRETIKICNILMQKAANRNSKIIDLSYFNKDETLNMSVNHKVHGISSEPNMNQPDTRIENSADFIKNPNDGKITEDVLETLTKKQKEIIGLLAKKPETPATIINKISLNGYKSKSHALRAINNILRRLVDAGIITRERNGKAYKYYLTQKVKTLLIDS